VKDAAITPYMSGKILEDEHFPFLLSSLIRVLNALMQSYLRLVGIRTIEQVS
jgi:hypothetical protein